MKITKNIFNSVYYKQLSDGRFIILDWKYRHDPVSLTLMVVGQVMAGQAAATEGKSAQNMENYNAAVEEQNAKQAIAKGNYEQQRQADEANRQQSSLAAEFGGSGVSASEGSPLMVKAKQASEDELSNFMIGYNAQTEAASHRNQAQLDIMQGKIYKQKGQNKAISEYMGAGSSLLTGFSKAGGF
jgi:hypothetical protein